MDMPRAKQKTLKYNFFKLPKTAPTNILLVMFAILSLCYAFPAMAQSGLEGRITETINALVRIVNVLIVGFVVWSGFLIAKGESSGFHRLIYGIVGLIVANGA